MNSYNKITDRIDSIGSNLCVGLDSSVNKLPFGIERNLSGLLEFNKSVIEQTLPYATAFKINFAFYERYGIEGFRVLDQTVAAIPDNIHIVGDAKRGDIGNTSKAYADSVFSEFRCDSVTVSPYMGSDSIEPFLEYSNKMVFVLALTSNKGSEDFQKLETNEGLPLYRLVMDKCCQWANHERLGFVVGATHPNELKQLRDAYQDRCFLIPGVGKQGGDAKKVNEANQGVPSLVNSSRGIIYAGEGEDWRQQVRIAAEKTAKALTTRVSNG